MPDKNYTDLANKGWSNMEALLDKEMPVKKDRRWLFFLLLFVLLGSAGSIGFLSWNQKSGKHSLQQKFEYAEGENEFRSEANLLKEEILEKPNVREQKIETETQSKKSSKDFSPSILENDVAASARNVNISARVGEKGSESSDPTSVREAGSSRLLGHTKNKNGSEALEGAIHANANGETSQTVGIASSQQPVQNGNLSTSMDYENLANLEVNNDNKISPRKDFIPLLAEINVANIKQFDSKSNLELPTSIPLKQSIITKPVFVELYGAYSFPLASQIHGPQFGLSLGKEVGRRWSINTSTGLHFLTAQSFISRTSLDNAIGNPIVEFADPPEFQDNNDLGEDLLVVEATDGRVALNNDYYDLVTERLGNLTYLDLGLNGRYKLSRNWSLNFGINYSYLLMSNTDFIGLFEFVPSLAQNAGGLESNVLLRNNLLNRHNFGLISGIRYQVSRRVGLSAGFNYGLNNIIKIENQSDYRNKLNFLNLRFDYKLYM